MSNPTPATTTSKPQTIDTAVKTADQDSKTTGQTSVLPAQAVETKKDGVKRDEQAADRMANETKGATPAVKVGV